MTAKRKAGAKSRAAGPRAAAAPSASAKRQRVAGVCESCKTKPVDPLEKMPPLTKLVRRHLETENPL